MFLEYLQLFVKFAVCFRCMEIGNHKAFLLTAVVLLAGCSAMDPVPERNNAPVNEPDAPSLVARGFVQDQATQEALRGIRIVLSAFDQQTVVRRDTSYTSTEGLFEVVSPQYDVRWQYTLSAFDIDGLDNGGQYQSSVIEIHINENSPSYNPGANSYLVDGNIFYLSH